MDKIILENDLEDISNTTSSSFSNEVISKPHEEIAHPITLSLFSGAGGLDIGFHKAGFKIVACVELEEAFCKTLQRNVGKHLDPDCQIINKDIREVLPEDIAANKIDFIIG